MFKYNTDTDTITTDKYLYDSMTMVRETSNSEYKVELSDINSVEGKAGTEIKFQYRRTLPTDSVISSEIVVDIPSDLEVKNVELNNKVIKASTRDYNVS